MSDADVDAVSGAGRERSPSFPYIGLSKAIERARILLKSARRFEVRMEDAAKDWGLGPKSSATLQTVAALLAYGLIEGRATPEGRKIKVSDTGWRILEDTRAGVRERLLAQAALRPDQFKKYAAEWHLSEGGDRPGDDHAVSQLKFEDGYSDEAARRFLRVFDEAVEYVRAGGTLAGEKADNHSDTEAEMEQNRAPKRDPMEDQFSMQTPDEQSAPSEHNTMKVMLDGDLLRVSATVDLQGAKKLLRRLRANIDLLESDDGDTEVNKNA